jgi:hypothetical protein
MESQQVPERLVETRCAWHLLAERVLSPLRVQETGNEIALEVTPGGFGTPELPDGRRLRVDGTDLVLADPNGDEVRAPIRSVSEAAGFADLADSSRDAAMLEIDPAAARFLGGFYALADNALRRFRDEVAADDPSPIRLWPEHFDVAFEAGAEAAGLRANYGASPGDDDHPEPYLYLGPWSARP